MFESPCTTRYKCLYGNKTVSTTAQPATTSTLPTTTVTTSTTLPPTSTPKPTPKNSYWTTFTICLVLGGFLLVAPTVWLVLRNYDSITLRNRTITPSSYENRFSALIGMLKNSEFNILPFESDIFTCFR